MTRKDYVAIAAAFKERVDMAHYNQNRVARLTHYAELANSIANVMACDNPRFDRAKFLVACGVAP